MSAEPSEPNTDETSETDNRHRNGETALAISNTVVRLLRTHAGRGPVKTKTTITHDLVIVTLGDCLTTVERTIAKAGHGALVVKGRTVLHSAIRAEAIAAVEDLTGRKVAAYLTDQHHDPDVAAIVFVFEQPKRVSAQ